MNSFSTPHLRATLGAQFPLVTTEVAVGERLWHVTAVQNEDALLETAEELEHFPYGFLLWESGVGLARHLAAHPELVAGKSILELGAGVGLSGLVAQSLGGSVWQSDHQPGTLSLARINAEQNGVAGVHCFLADWGRWTHRERYAVILGADILYERQMHFHLEHIFHQNLAPDGKLILSDPGRTQAMEFVAHLEKQGWRVTLETQTVLLEDVGQENRPVEVALMTLS
jgi:predicted nicotinamide N-methyase